MTTKSQSRRITIVPESSVGLNNAFEIQNRLSGILVAAFFFLLSLCAKSRRATPQSAVKQRRKPKINVSSLLTSPSFARSLCIRTQRVQSASPDRSPECSARSHAFRHFLVPFWHKKRKKRIPRNEIRVSLSRQY